MVHSHKNDIVGDNLKVYDYSERLSVITNGAFKSVVDTNNHDYYQDDMELKNFFKNNFKVLDFACGPGFFSSALAPYASEIIKLDIAQMMVNAYNERVKNQGIYPKEVHAELIEDEGGKEELFVSSRDEYFDAAIFLASYYHLPDPADTTQKIVKTSKPGGKLFVFDRASYTPKRIDEEMRNLGVFHTGGSTKDEIFTKI